MASGSLPDLRAVLPPTRAWLIIDVAVVAVVAALVLIHGTLVAQAGDLEAARPAPHTRAAVLDEETRTALLERFPARPATAADRLRIDTEMMQLLGELGLSLDTRTIDGALMPGFPPRQRLTMVILGSAASQVRYLEHVLVMSAPIRIVQLEWSEGDGPERRRLTLTLEIFVADEE